MRQCTVETIVEALRSRKGNGSPQSLGARRTFSAVRLCRYSSVPDTKDYSLHSGEESYRDRYEYAVGREELSLHDSEFL